MIVAGEHVARWVSDRLGFGLCPPYTTMGIERDGEIVGGVIFNQFEGTDVAFTAAGSGWTPGFMRAVGDYVFGQLGCIRMTAITRDPRVVQYAKRLGGEVEGRLRSHFGLGIDGVIVGILREDWPYASFRGNKVRLNTFTRSCQKEACFEDPQSS